METRARSLAKTVSWRLIAFLTTFIFSFLFTGNLETSVALAILINIVKCFFYYLHERVWLSVGWGIN